MHAVSAAADEIVERHPIVLAKLRERGLRNLRFGFSIARRDHYTPMRRRK